MLHCITHKLFMKKMLQKLYKNISTDGEVMSNIKVASFFLGHRAYVIYDVTYQ